MTTPSSSSRRRRAPSCVALGKRGASRPLRRALRDNASPFGGRPATPPPCVHEEWPSPAVIAAQRRTPAEERDASSQGVAAERMVLIGAVGTGAQAPELVWSARSVCVVVVASFFSSSSGTTTDQSVGLVVVFDRRRSGFGARFIGFVVAVSPWERSVSPPLLSC